MDIAKIFKIREKIQDPKFIIFVDGAIGDDEQTAYRVGESKYYDSENERIDINISDSMLDEWLSIYSDDEIIIKALEMILMRLDTESLKSIKTGAEDLTFQDLNSKVKFYSYLLDYYKNKKNSKSTFKMGLTKQPTIAGGNV